jgi:hypothetical protein
LRQLASSSAWPRTTGARSSPCTSGSIRWIS